MSYLKEQLQLQKNIVKKNKKLSVIYYYSFLEKMRFLTMRKSSLESSGFDH